VRHSLEKELSARIDSVPTFLQELHAALNSAPVVAAALRETVSMDPNKTMASTTSPIKQVPNLSTTATQPPVAPKTHVGALAGSTAGAARDTQFENAPATAVDPETTHVRGSTASPESDAGSIPALQVGPRKQMIVDFGPTRKGPRWLLLGAVVMVFVLAGVGITVYLKSQSGSVSTNSDPTPTPTVVPPKTRADLVAIDGGSFMMGLKTGLPFEKPVHLVTVQRFSMDRTEVTNSDYAEFVNDTNHAPPSHWSGTKPPAGQELWPAVNVSFDDALAFAEWRSKRDGVNYRLPTEQEWEFAARNGERGDLYPWGPKWKDGVAVLKEENPAPVGSRPGGKNRWGVVDLIGNVWEWTSTRAAPYPGYAAVVPSEWMDWVAIRGGGFVTDPADPKRPVYSPMREFITPSKKTPLLGFRLVRSGP
jgi:formylglycine-generating enzyme required for sulfatase activity